MSARKQEMRIVFLAMLITALFTSTGLAAEEPELKIVKLEGFVSVLRDINDVLISVELVTDEDIYDIVLDAKGLELGEEMEGEEVEVEGVISKEDDQEWLKVLTFEAIVEEGEE
jgi:phage-related protein